MMGEKNTVRFADEIIALSEGIQCYSQNTCRKNTVYITNGVERPDFRKTKIIKDTYCLEKDSYMYVA